MNGGDHTTEYNKWKEAMEWIRPSTSTNTYSYRIDKPQFINWGDITSAVSWDSPIDLIKHYRFDVDRIRDIHMYDDGHCELTVSGYDYEVTLVFSKKATEALLSKLDITCYKAASEEEIDKFLE